MDDAPGMTDLDGLFGKFPTEFRRFLSLYDFALNEVSTKLEILQSEYTHLHDRNPIEHISKRLKNPQNIIDKAKRKGSGLSFDEIRESVQDIAGMRVVCSFVSDVYAVADALCAQTDIEVIEVEDYVARPKPNGYRSLHATIRIPVFLSQGPEEVYVELQFRTIAMDFWASLEHKIFYKYDGHVPQRLLTDLAVAAETSAQLDRDMERIHTEMGAIANAAG
jgi:putative GTP pyrophosphokinase